MIWVCNKCGGDNVEIMAWVNINSGKIEDITHAIRSRKTFCHDCKSDSGIKLGEKKISTTLF